MKNKFTEISRHERIRVLIIKTSSLGDLFHTMPALMDAKNIYPNISFDWVVEEGFSEVPLWYPLVDRVIPVSFRRWKKSIFKALFRGEWLDFVSQLQAEEYDRVIDAQGLIKSAVMTYFARGLRVGLDKSSLTEPLARFAYQKTVTVDLQKHAIWRMRSLFSQALNYPMPDTEPDSGLKREQFFSHLFCSGNYVLFLHGTTWASKHWSDDHWIELAQLFAQKNIQIRLPFSNEKEKERAEKIAASCSNVEVLPKMSLTLMASEIACARAVVSVDTGLSHLAATLNVPVITLYGPTDPKRIGTFGHSVKHIITKSRCLFCKNKRCEKNESETAPCMKMITPKEVYEACLLSL